MGKLIDTVLSSGKSTTSEKAEIIWTRRIRENKQRFCHKLHCVVSAFKMQ